MSDLHKAYPELYGHPDESEVSKSSSENLSPGSKCPSCERRIPYPKKASSPKTRVLSIRVPADDYDALKEVIEAASYAQDPLRDDGKLVRERPHWQYWTVFFALAEWLQDHVA